MFLSGGGNDFAGFNDLRPLLKDDCSAQTTVKGCFRAGSAGLKGFLERMDEYYRKLIGIVYTRTPPRLPHRDALLRLRHPQRQGGCLAARRGWRLPWSMPRFPPHCTRRV